MRRSETEAHKATLAPNRRAARSDGRQLRRNKGALLSRRALLIAAGCCVSFSTGSPAQAPLRLVALGDSLTAGFGLPAESSFPALLQRELVAKGKAVTVANAGVSGDTAEAGLARLDWSVPNDTQGVILELGANDALRGLDPKRCEATLDRIITTLKARDIAVLLCGMKAPRNLGTEYVEAFDAIYPRLSAKYGLILYPFFLDGVAGEQALTLPDKLHPNAEGVRVIIGKMLPVVETFLASLEGH
ncbi:MAG: arylesterase [Hyphomicrobiales bacterium]|nr:arylesterase [Hyphomicrobiales bacterium]